MGVYKLIDDGFYVISTRYYFSSLAYNCHNSEQFDFISKLNHKFPPPDATIYLDIPVTVSQQRTKSRSVKEIYENESKLTLVKTNYEQIFSNYSGSLLTIDGTQKPDLIQQQIVNFLSL